MTSVKNLGHNVNGFVFYKHVIAHVQKRYCAGYVFEHDGNKSWQCLQSYAQSVTKYLPSLHLLQAPGISRHWESSTHSQPSQLYVPQTLSSSQAVLYASVRRPFYTVQAHPEQPLSFMTNLGPLKAYSFPCVNIASL